jgi:hypothetical protein
MKSLSKLILASPLILTAQTEASPQAAIRANITLRLDKAALIPNQDNLFDSHILEMLKYRNIYVDKKTTIQIHEEDNFVDLNCFDCLIQGVESNTYEHSPDNKEVFKP